MNEAEDVAFVMSIHDSIDAVRSEHHEPTVFLDANGWEKFRRGCLAMGLPDFGETPCDGLRYRGAAIRTQSVAVVSKNHKALRREVDEVFTIVSREVGPATQPETLAEAVYRLAASKRAEGASDAWVGAVVGEQCEAILGRLMVALGVDSIGEVEAAVMRMLGKAEDNT